MIQGRVDGLQAKVDIIFRLPGQPDLRLQFVVDTGFAGALTLPPRAAAAMRLPFVTELDANLADDSTVRTDVHAAKILWDGVEKDIAVLAIGIRPLIGTALLDGHRLTVDFEDDGGVVIELL